MSVYVAFCEGIFSSQPFPIESTRPHYLPYLDDPTSCDGSCLLRRFGQIKLFRSINRELSYLVSSSPRSRLNHSTQEEGIYLCEQQMFPWARRGVKRVDHGSGFWITGVSGVSSHLWGDSQCESQTSIPSIGPCPSSEGVPSTAIHTFIDTHKPRHLPPCPLGTCSRG